MEPEVLDIGFAEAVDDVKIIDVTRYEYAYVIYDLKHKSNMEVIRSFYQQNGIILNGRFDNFEYWNMDRILRESFNLIRELSRLGQK